MHERYRGDFYSRKGVVWTCSILQEADSPFAEVGDLDFPADEALVIEWPSKAKEEVICGSTATLTIVSPGDRTYEDLYTVEPGRIRLDVFREGTLYWSGCLDPEFYEEPYCSGQNYDVTFTFSDFGILGRLKYNLTDLQTLRALLDDALARSGINYGSVDENAISTFLDASTRLTLDRLQVRSDNWFDEDGQASTMAEVLEGILQPLGLKLVQKAGTVYVYDINGLHSSAASGQIAWADVDQVMGVDRVANDVRVTFSPYADSSLMKEEEYRGAFSEDQKNLSSDKPSDGDYYSYHLDYDPDWDYEDISLTIFLSRTGGLQYVNPLARYFHILPLLGGGDEASGVAQWFYTGGHGSLDSGRPVRKPAASQLPEHAALMTTKRVHLPGLSESDRNKLLLRIRLDMLCDPRYNFNADPGEFNEKANCDYVHMFTQCFVPVQVRLYDSAGTEAFHYSNVSAEHILGNIGKLHRTMGSWIPGTASWDECVFQYYDPIDESACAVMGWKANRQMIGLDHGKIYPSFAALEPGQYIPYPPQGGWLEISVLGDICPAPDGIGWRLLSADTLRDFKSRIRWMLYRTPVVELVKDNVTHSLLQSADQEYSGILNASAKESLDIRTVCGTMPRCNPSARGLYYLAATRQAAGEMTRAGRTARPEQLLIGTLYSQYARRMVTLSGTAGICDAGLRWYTDAAQPQDRKFMLLSEVQNVILDESEITAAEFRPDEYKSTEET